MNKQIVQSVTPSSALTSQECTEADRVYFKNQEYYYYEKKQKEYINQGSYGQVFNCYRTQEKEINQQNKLCVKVLSNSNKDDKQLKYLIQEIKIIQKLQESKQKLKNLMEIIDVHDGSTKHRCQMYIVMEKYDGDLSILMNGRKDKGLSINEQIDAMQQIMNGYISLHEMDMIHRDLKPKNILYKIIDQDKIIFKITDFGFAKVIKDKEVEQELSNIGTLTYVSPQIINQNHFSYKTDIFSMGIIFYQLIFKGKHPFASDFIKNEQYIANLKQLEQDKIVIPEIQGEYGQQLKYLLENMLTYHEQDRISIKQIKQLDIFKIPTIISPKQIQEEDMFKTPFNQFDQKPKIRRIFKGEQQNQITQNIQNINSTFIINQFLQYNLAKIQLLSLFIQHLFQENNFVNNSVRIKTFHMQMIIVSLSAIRKIYIMQAYGVIKNQPENIPSQLLQQPHSFQQYLHQYQIYQNEQSQQLHSQFNEIISLQDDVDFQYQRTIALNFIELNKNKQATPTNLIQELSDQFNKLLSQKVQQSQLDDYIKWLKWFFQKLWLRKYIILERDNQYITLTYQYLKVMNLETDHPLSEFKQINLNDLTFVMSSQLMRQYVEDKKDIN